MVNNIIQKIGTRLTRPARWGIVGAVVVLGLGVMTYRAVALQPKVISPAGPSLGTTEVSNQKPVVIVFSHPVKRAGLKSEIFPALRGAWKLETNFWSSQSTLTFTPAETPALDTRYTISLTGITGLSSGSPQQYLLSFQTGPMPVSKSITPTDVAVDVLPDEPIILSFDRPVTEAVDVTIGITPAMTLDAAKVDGQIVTFSHSAQFEKNTKYTITAWMSTAKTDYTSKTRTVSEDKTQLVMTSFTTVAAPGLGAHSPSGAGVDPAIMVRLEFKQPMEHELTQAAFTLSPATPGAFTWLDDQTMIFTPAAPLTKNQEYTATLTTSAKAKSGFTFDASFSWSFTTIGAAAIISASPSGGAANVDPATTISVGFNQPVVTASAESKFSITPAVTGTFTWSESTMVFHPAATLVQSQTYTIAVAAGVQSVKGTTSVIHWSSTFTTRSQSVMLSVPAYRQAHMYSCMIAAARSAMAYRHVSASESDIIARVGRDTTAWSGTWGGDNGVWGDPDVKMVGGLDNAAATGKKGSTNVTWGYGSHWAPISRVLTSYGIGNDVQTGMTVQQLAQEIKNNNPVIVWWVNGIWPSYEVNWKTPSGKSIRGVNGLHVQVVRGFTGSVENPTSFTVTDSGYGYPGKTFDVGTFKAKWNWFGNTGIVVK